VFIWPGSWIHVMKDCRICMAAHNNVTLRYACSSPSAPEHSTLSMHSTLFYVTESLPTTFIWEFWAIQCLHKQHSVPVRCTINRIFWLMFLHHALWYNYATWTNELHTFQINILIQCFNFWRLPHVSNHHENETWGSKHIKGIKNLKTELNH